jgi:hypothetical protein
LHSPAPFQFLAQAPVCPLSLFSQNVVDIGLGLLEVPTKPTVVCSTSEYIESMQSSSNNGITSSYLAISGSTGGTGGGTGVETRAGAAVIVKEAAELDAGTVGFKLS